MTTYYLSGPMRTKPEFNYPAFEAVEKQLAQEIFAGDVILNPINNFNGESDHPVTEYMNLDLKMVLEADVVVLLPDWEESEGAAREVQLATWAGKKFMLATESPLIIGEWRFHEVDMVNRSSSPRASVLEEATQLITGDRNNAYGPPTQDFQRTANMASAFGFQVNGEPLKSHHVAILMVLLKMSRLAWTPTKRDSWVDTAGYAGCGYECAVEEAKA